MQHIQLFHSLILINSVVLVWSGFEVDNTCERGIHLEWNTAGNLAYANTHTHMHTNMHKYAHMHTHLGAI